ncbi:hypothetical protein S1361_30680 [Streptomyces cyanogenus]|uniref:Uncharacterized protein n=1 Tax=Streptomyces cyanogenus TaxID=80860 RepID=A0ABX7TY77_STRCY|nr:hypothetical protein S1361_30680 [Streptomyces cyanogenus]
MDDMADARGRTGGGGTTRGVAGTARGAAGTVRGAGAAAPVWPSRRSKSAEPARFPRPPRAHDPPEAPTYPTHQNPPTHPGLPKPPAAPFRDPGPPRSVPRWPARSRVFRGDGDQAVLRLLEGY